MKKFERSIIVLLLVALLASLCFVFPSAAANNASITVQSMTAHSGETVDVQLVIKNNPGIIGMTINVDYNSADLTLIEVSDGEILGTNTHKPELSNPYTLSWSNDTASKNIVSNGVIATLHFRVNNDNPTDFCPITLRYDLDNYDIYDADIHPVKFEIFNGGVNILPSTDDQDNYLLGDVDGDNVITILDATTLQRYLLSMPIACSGAIELRGDIDRDGLNITDATLIQRYLADISVGYPINTRQGKSNI